jgi:hypothetical protein
MVASQSTGINKRTYRDRQRQAETKKRVYTDKKENRIFLIHKKIQSGAVAKSYMTNGLLIWGNICAFPHILGNPSSYMILQLLHSEIPYTVYEENFLFFFIM